jgi:excisionase family DNA binding protein
MTSILEQIRDSLTADGVAELVGVKRPTVNEWIRVGVNGHKLSARKVLRRNRILRADLEQFLQKISLTM